MTVENFTEHVQVTGSFLECSAFINLLNNYNNFVRQILPPFTLQVETEAEKD